MSIPKPREVIWTVVPSCHAWADGVTLEGSRPGTASCLYQFRNPAALASRVPRPGAASPASGFASPASQGVVRRVTASRRWPWVHIRYRRAPRARPCPCPCPQGLRRLWSDGVVTDERTLTEIAETVAADAAALVRERHADLRGGGAMNVGTKSSATDVVTAADTESERLIRARLAELRPGDAVLGEEEGNGATGGGSGGVTWVVDPIDGTVNFLYGYPAFAVSVAAQIDGVSVAGAVVEPVSGRRWTGTTGAGAWLDGVPLRCGSPDNLDLTLLATGFAYRSERRQRQARLVAAMLGRVRDIRRGGSSALDLCAVAAGWVDAYCEHGLSRWDWAAGALIAAEAGARVSLPGTDSELGADAILASAPTVADPLRAALIDCGVAEV
ncbi:MAG: inositol monophosphatase [Actinophytocola sp.]|nr:inositol monophosphatase [Actinophytocola sp.]